MAENEIDVVNKTSDSHLEVHISMHDPLNDQEQKDESPQPEENQLIPVSTNILDNETKNDINDNDPPKTVRKSSIEILQDEHNSNESIPITVPDVDLLNRFKFWGMPLNIQQVTAFWKELIDMGFAEQAEAALIYTNAESVEDAIEFIEEKGNEYSWHQFVPLLPDNNNNSNSLTQIIIKEEEKCANCDKLYNRHLLNEIGKKKY